MTTEQQFAKEYVDAIGLEKGPLAELGNEMHVAAQAGLAKERRERIATAALQGLIASNFYDRYCDTKVGKGPFEPTIQVAVSIVLEYTDALIAALDAAPVAAPLSSPSKPI